MRSPDLEVRGALYSMIINLERASRIKSALQLEDYYAFILDYLEQCIEQDPDGDWSDSRYLAGHALVGRDPGFLEQKSSGPSGKAR